MTGKDLIKQPFMCHCRKRNIRNTCKICFSWATDLCTANSPAGVEVTGYGEPPLLPHWAKVKHKQTNRVSCLPQCIIFPRLQINPHWGMIFIVDFPVPTYFPILPGRHSWVLKLECCCDFPIRLQTLPTDPGERGRSEVLGSLRVFFSGEKCKSPEKLLH